MTLDTGIERVREILKEICPNDKTDSTKNNDISDNEYATMILSGIFILLALLLCK